MPSQVALLCVVASIVLGIAALVTEFTKKVQLVKRKPALTATAWACFSCKSIMINHAEHRLPVVQGPIEHQFSDTIVNRWNISISTIGVFLLTVSLATFIWHTALAIVNKKQW